MPERLTKLRPDRDLQCYFQRPSAAASLSKTSASGFVVSGCWRQQFDWAVVEWNRDNVYEHPALRNLPDGNLSGIHLTYDEVRQNCISLDSTLYPTVDWPYLRIWAEQTGADTFYRVPISNYATAREGGYAAATAQMQLQGTPSTGDYIELAWFDQHFNYQLTAIDTLESAVAALARVIHENLATGHVDATATGTSIVLSYQGEPGQNGNRAGVYGTVHGAGTESWAPMATLFSGGNSPKEWRVDLDFGNLQDERGIKVPTTNVRKMRWTWAADLQQGDFQRSEFAVTVSNWNVTGQGLEYGVAGPGSRRIEDDAAEFKFAGAWTEARGNYSGGSIRWGIQPGTQATCTYQQGTAHSLYLGTRRSETGGTISIQIDRQPPSSFNLKLAGEDILVRLPLGQMAGNVSHTVVITHTGGAGSSVYVDFLEAVVPALDLPSFDRLPTTTLATDWDTDHSLALAPERTAWLIAALGFQGRANHYAGALWFYELVSLGHVYASATIQFSGAPEWSRLTTVSVGTTAFQHVNLIGDTAESIAKCFELLINSGATGVRAEASGGLLKIMSRIMGTAGNGVPLAANSTSAGLTIIPSGPLAGGQDGTWRVDLAAVPRMNRAARDWNRSYFRALQGYGIDAAAAFSMELQHGDDTVAAGIAQRYPNGDPVWLNTPALQTNFSPASTDFWKQVYLDMARVMMEAGVTPYLQFGEVQWWYFAAPSGMPFYDQYTKSAFQAAYNTALQTISSEHAAPEAYPQECAFLPTLIGQFTDSIVAFVLQVYPSCQFEVLYPPDVNDTPLNRIINFPSGSWTPAKLKCLKTENFTYTGARDLDKARSSILLPMEMGFPRLQASHLVGIGEYTTPWSREQMLALGEGIESVVLFALDQFCLIGYQLSNETGMRRALFMGAE
jgi:hypothetical protein